MKFIGDKQMIKSNKHIGMIDDCAAGTIGTLYIPEFFDPAWMIGARVTIELKDEDGKPIIKSGKLIKILEDKLAVATWDKNRE